MELEPGGRFRPEDCSSRHRVAVIIPYRDRIEHLSVFIHHLHPILQRQQIDYAIYVVEQAGKCVEPWRLISCGYNYEVTGPCAWGKSKRTCQQQ